MKRNLGASKNIIKYLEGRYGKFHNQSFDDDLVFIESLRKDHTFEQLVMMSRRIEAYISVKKDSYSLTINPLTLLPVFLTLLISIVIGYTTISSNVLLSFLTNSVNINKEKISQEDLTKIINSLDYSNIFGLIIKNFGLISIVIVIVVSYWGIVQIKYTAKCYSSSLLLQEAIELKEKEIKVESESPSS